MNNCKESILNALDHLYDLNSMIYDYWISVLYDEEEHEVSEQWNLQTLYQINQDVNLHSEL
jgi:hypothetical protein